MNTLATQNRKIVDVPYRITIEQIEEVLSIADAIYDSTRRKFMPYSIDNVFNMIMERFTSMPALALLEDTELFYDTFKPSDFMFDNGLAGRLSDIMKLSPVEIKKQKCYITEKGVFFLLTVLYRLRDEIDNAIFYK